MPDKIKALAANLARDHERFGLEQIKSLVHAAQDGPGITGAEETGQHFLRRTEQRFGKHRSIFEPCFKFADSFQNKVVAIERRAQRTAGFRNAANPVQRGRHL